MVKVAPYSTGIFETIVDVHFGDIFLLVIAGVGNSSFSFGPYPPPPAISTPSIRSSGKSVKLIDTFRPPGGNVASSGFIGCISFSSTGTAQEFWRDFPRVGFDATNNSCPWPGGGSIPDGITVAPVDYVASKTATAYFLYSIAAKDGLVDLHVTGVQAAFDSGLNADNGQITKSGGAGMSALVYSTIKGKVKKVSDLIDFRGDGKPRPTEDDRYDVSSFIKDKDFKIHIKLDKDPAHAQISNYGKTFQPYKALVSPNIGIDHKPSQPPVRLH